MIVFLDIDHTLAHSAWRDPMIGGEGGWDAYYEAGDKDEPVMEMVRLVDALSCVGHTVIGSTGRPEKWRTWTMSWLVRHSVMLDDLLMRADNDFRPSPQIKLDHARRVRPDIVIDDRDDIRDAFLREGVFVLQTFIPRIKE